MFYKNYKLYEGSVPLSQFLSQSHITISVVRNANRVFNTMHSETRSPQDVKVSFWLSFMIITSGLH